MSKSKPALPVRLPIFRDLFVITDTGRDQDDEDVLVALNRFIRLEILNVLGVVANLAPSAQRARLARGTLNVLGQSTIPVGIGTSCNQPDDDGLQYQFAVGYLCDPAELLDGKTLILNTLRQAKPKSIVLILLSGLTDAAAALQEHMHLFASAVRRVCIMGGVVAQDDLPCLDEEGRMIPDMKATNHGFDKDATAFLYRQLQDLGIPITVVTRHACAPCKVPRGIYDKMAATGHPVGIRLRDAQKEAIQHLWQRSNLASGDPARLGLPDRCDRSWFLNAFCAGQGAHLGQTDSIWDAIESFMLYDPCTLIAAIPNLREHFFTPSVVEVHGVEHLVIGVSAQVHGVRKPKELAKFLETTLVESLKLSLKQNRALRGRATG